MALEKPTYREQAEKVESIEDYINKRFPGIEDEVLDFTKKYEKITGQPMAPSYLEQAAGLYNTVKGQDKAAETVLMNLRKRMDTVKPEAGADKQQMKQNLNKIYMAMERKAMNLGEKSEQELQETFTALEKTLEIATILDDKMRMANLTKWKNQVADALASKIKQAM